MTELAYLDHAATSPLRPEALAAMLPYLTQHFGNPSGGHAAARQAAAALDEARHGVAAVLGVTAGEIVFCASGTESCNLAVLGALRAHGARPEGIALCSAVEHHAVLRAAAARPALPPRVVGVDSGGRVDFVRLDGALDEDISLVSVMAANNEVGTVQPVAGVAALARRRASDVLVHTDAVGAGALDLAELASAVDLLSLGPHKFGGPKGVGILMVRAGVTLAPLLYGGPQERERRPGTQDVASAVGAAAALTAAAAHRREEWVRLELLRTGLLDGLLSIPGAEPTVPGDGGSDVAVVPTVVSVRFDGIDQEELLLLLDREGVCASAGAACASGAVEPSHVLRAMGYSSEMARQVIRFSLGWSTTAGDVERAVAATAKGVEQLRR
ncbi:MAG: cysteine desulfurase family protein [Acidimicrobiales bacterium]